MWTWLKTVFSRGRYALKRVLGWFKRAFFKEKDFKTGKIEKPSALLREAFFQKKSGVIAFCVLIGLFITVFLLPLLMPININYTDNLQQNIAPNYSMLRLPNSLKRQIDVIDGFADFTVGLSKSGKVYVWGNTKDNVTKRDMKAIPQNARENVKFISAGKDHILAINQQGEVVGWGDKSCGQYGAEQVLNAVTMPDFLVDGVDVSQVKQLVCGYQTSALVMQDGKAYLWGNSNIVKNLSEVAQMEQVEKVAFTNSNVVFLLKDGNMYGLENTFTLSTSLKEGKTSNLSFFLQNKKVVDVTATNKCIALLLDGGDLVVSGVFENEEDVLPTLQEEEYFMQIDGGARHFVGLTNLGNVYAWGHNEYKQCNIKNKEKATKIYAGALQTYTVNSKGKLIEKAGLKGYLMGTDNRGRDVFKRIIHGGKMTMTVGGVAVLISTAIALIVGCISGYFGGVVDTLLMRVTEIFSSIPFLPFAMLLSQIIKYYNLTENARIFIIMLILGSLSWTGLARMIRGQVLAEREKEFVTASKSMGVKNIVIAFRHILPNIISVVLVSVTLDFAGCLLTESSLSYLGFGVQQPQPTWGNMLNGCNNSTIIQYYWWQWLFPALFLSIAVICINVLGDRLRDTLDPRSNV